MRTHIKTIYSEGQSQNKFNFILIILPDHRQLIFELFKLSSKLRLNNLLFNLSVYLSTFLLMPI
jgi:hypothetical protein